jgi:hypothetical protein
MSQNPLETLAKETDQGLQPLVFVPVDDYTTFRAEFAVTEGDLVFHFFLAGKSSTQGPGRYWEVLFPAVLEAVAKDIFKAGYPRLQAKHMNDFDIDSWWFRAFGFGQVLDPHKLAYKFLDALDLALDTKKDT